MTKFRRCKKCGQDKLLSEFVLHTKATDGRRHECYYCYRARINLNNLKHSERRLARAKERYAANPVANWSEERKQGRRDSQKRQRDGWRMTVFDHYGWRCSCCGEATPEFLTIDHVNSNGAEHRRDNRVKASLYRWIMRNVFPGDFQTLCYNCNCGRYRNGGICPHKVTEGSSTIPQGSTLQAIGSGSAQPSHLRGDDIVRSYGQP